MAFGWAHESIALFGFGASRFIALASACLVLWKLMDHGDLPRKRTATRRIGWLFPMLGGGITGGALLQFAGHRQPPTTLPGLLLSALSLSFLVFRWLAKSRVARALDSAALAAEASRSRACIQLSAVLFQGSLLFLLARSPGWMDATAALILAILIAREGWRMLQTARGASFTGGGGCGDQAARRAPASVMPDPSAMSTAA